MPLYSFRCRSCEVDFDVSRPLSQATAPAPCPGCAAEATRVFTPPAVTGTASPPRAKPSPEAAASRWRHHGHSHGPGVGGHAH
jgi:putative FmdB family regulatory protein